jgi:hypothetical protein
MQVLGLNHMEGCLKATEHIVQPLASQTQTQDRATVADVPKPKEADGAGPAKKKKLDKNGCFRCKKSWAFN